MPTEFKVPLMLQTLDRRHVSVKLPEFHARIAGELHFQPAATGFKSSVIGSANHGYTGCEFLIEDVESITVENVSLEREVVVINLKSGH